MFYWFNYSAGGSAPNDGFLGGSAPNDGFLGGSAPNDGFLAVRIDCK